jgi:hypothetical protein
MMRGVTRHSKTFNFLQRNSSGPGSSEARLDDEAFAYCLALVTYISAPPECLGGASGPISLVSGVRFTDALVMGNPVWSRVIVYTCLSSIEGTRLMVTAGVIYIHYGWRAE